MSDPTALLAEIRLRLRSHVEMPDTTFGFLVDGVPYLLTVTQGKSKIEKVGFLPGGRDVTLTLSEQTLTAIIAGTQGAMSAYLTGKIKVDGQVTTAQRLGSLFN